MFQIVFVEGDHWIAISNLQSRKRTKLYLYDTLERGLNSERESVIRNMYREPVELTVKKVMRQVGGVHCGDYCCAIIALANYLDPSQITFDSSRMRHHTIKCLESKRATQYPII